MLNAQKTFYEVYKEPRKEWVEEIKINGKKWEGSLKIEGFINLKEIICSDNKITSLKIVNCPNLKKLSVIITN